MERFTNKYTRFLEEVKQELVAYDTEAGERIIVRYLEMPWIAGDWASFFVLGNDSGISKVVHKRWNREYDRDRFDKGIFNLDRIAIMKERLELSPGQVADLGEWLYRIVRVPELSDGGIVLDGIESIFFIDHGSIRGECRWNTGPDKVDSFAPLIAYLKTLFSFHY